MINRLQELAQEERYRSLRSILSLPSPDEIVHAIFGNESYANIRASYRIQQDQQEIIAYNPNAGTFSFRTGVGLDGIAQREALARSIQQIQDDQLKVRWMSLLLRDREHSVQGHAALAYQNLTSQELRDEWAKKLAMTPAQDDEYRVIREAAAKGLPSVSPALRFKLVKNLADGGSIGQAAAAAVTSFGAPAQAMLAAWVADQNKLTLLDRNLAYLASPRFQRMKISPRPSEMLGSYSPYDVEVSKLTRSLKGFKSTETYVALKKRFSEIATDQSSPNRDLARDILKSLELQDLANQYAEALRQKAIIIPKDFYSEATHTGSEEWNRHPIREQWDAQFLNASGDSGHLRTHYRYRFMVKAEETVRGEQQGGGETPVRQPFEDFAPTLDEWTQAQIQDFERSLQP